MVHGILDMIKLKNLSWCKVLPYSEGKFGGWVSENFLAIARIADWFFSILIFLPERSAYQDPTRPYSQWTKKENIAWLQARGIISKGSARIVRERVKQFHVSGNIPVVKESTTCTTEEVLKMVHTMRQMISKSMARNINGTQVHELEALIRYFLIKYDKFECSISDARNPGWISSYNFLSLLNVPELVEKFGGLRHLWEGGEDGEGFLKGVKNELKCGLVRQWQVWVIKNLLEEKTLDRIIISNNRKKTADTVMESGEYKIYGSKKRVKQLLQNNYPISGFEISKQKGTTNKFVAYRKKGTIYTCLVKLDEGSAFNLNYMIYRKLVITVNEQELINCLSQNKPQGILLLPLLSADGYNNDQQSGRYYCSVSSNWSDNES
jgi:hypothetical protein